MFASTSASACVHVVVIIACTRQGHPLSTDFTLAERNIPPEENMFNGTNILVMIKAAQVLEHRVRESADTWMQDFVLEDAGMAGTPVKMEEHGVHSAAAGVSTASPFSSSSVVLSTDEPLFSIEAPHEQLISPSWPNGTERVIRRFCQQNSLCYRYQVACWSHLWNFFEVIQKYFVTIIAPSFNWLLVVDDDTYVFRKPLEEMVGKMEGNYVSLAGRKPRTATTPSISSETTTFHQIYAGSLQGTRTPLVKQIASTAAGALFSRDLLLAIFEKWKEKVNGEKHLHEEQILHVCRAYGQGDDTAMGGLALQFANLTGLPNMHRTCPPEGREKELVREKSRYEENGVERLSIDRSLSFGWAPATAHCCLRTQTVNQFWKEAELLEAGRSKNRKHGVLEKGKKLNCWQKWRQFQSKYGLL
ncbi:unnamed protein product [Amoebophrya sp. A120]|nr:unnamed protein product [Amoebophrya sp. A120]|eukprot:GSA120T00024338001.1